MYFFICIALGVGWAKTKDFMVLYIIYLEQVYIYLYIYTRMYSCCLSLLLHIIFMYVFQGAANKIEV